MAIPTLKELYEFSLIQLVAESYLEDPSALRDERQLYKYLTLGTNRPGYNNSNENIPDDADLNQGWPGFTRMTDSQVEEFNEKFKVIHQWSDNPSTGRVPGSRPEIDATHTAGLLLNGQNMLANTGFSATLIQHGDTNEYTLAIRSTESRPWEDGGDSERDMEATDKDSIVITGFAVAQLDALEKYYEWLKVNGLLPRGSTLNVTGYSLGGHLATVFTEIHQDDTWLGEFGDTVTFNGAGRGDWNSSAGTEADFLAYYRQVLKDPASATIDASVYSTGDLFRAAAWLYFAEFSLVNPFLVAYTDFEDILDLRREEALECVGQEFDAKSIYQDPRYAWAMVATILKYDLTAQPPVNEGSTLADSQITQTYGYESIRNLNMTANSQNNGPQLKIVVESQPVIDRAGGFLYGWGDYGYGHSIDLIIDSLALQRAIAELDAGFNSAVFISVMPKVSAMDTRNVVYTNYEADPLENILDSLRYAVLGPGVSETTFVEGAGGFGDWGSRNTYHANIKALTDSDVFTAIAGKVQFCLADVSQQFSARDDFGCFLGLYTLSPVYLRALPGQEAFVAEQLAAAWPDLYAEWASDSRSSRPEYFSDQWLQDRAAMLAGILQVNAANADDRTTRDAAGIEGLHFQDYAWDGEVTVLPAYGNDVRRQVLFDTNTPFTSLVGSDFADRLYAGIGGSHLDGGLGDDQLEGRSAREELYGGAGRDILRGMAGDDILVGGKDADRLEGGIGIDEYRIALGDGVDTLQDSDGNGRIVLDGQQLSGGLRESASSWLSPDGRYRYVLASEPGSEARLFIYPAGGNRGSDITLLIVEGFHPGDLGLALPGAPEPGSSLPQPILGDVDPAWLIQFDADGSTTQTLQFDELGNVIGTPNTLPGPDLLFGSNGADEIRGGFGQDTLFGNDAKDRLEGEDASDLLAGGLGRDELLGGAGDDILSGDGILVGNPLNDGYAPTTASVFASMPEVTFLESGIGWATGSIDTHTWLRNYNPNGLDATEEVVYLDDTVRFATTRMLAAPHLGIAGQGQGDVDLLDGGDGNDGLTGGAGGDRLLGGAGDDRLNGGSGNDWMEGGADSDLLLGDAMVYSQFIALSRGVGGAYFQSPETETYEAEIGADFMWGGDGNDYLYGMAGSDFLHGEGDDDVLVGDFEENYLTPYLYWDDAAQAWTWDYNSHLSEAVAFHGDDYLDGGAGNDTLWGMAGADHLVGGSGNDALEGDGSPDVVGVRFGDDFLDGGDGDDALKGGGADDELYGGDGNDRLWGDDIASGVAAGFDLPVFASMTGQALTPLAQANHGVDLLDGGNGHDILVGGGFNDRLLGGEGNDQLWGDGPGVAHEGDDTLLGGNGDDQLVGGGGQDWLYGEAGQDNIFADAGNDQIMGGDGDDFLYGGAGNDTIDGGRGRDVQRGEAGDDLYLLRAGDSLVIDNVAETIDDSSGSNTLRFDDSVSLDALVIRKAAIAGDLALQYTDNDTVYLKNGLTGALSWFDFAGGSFYYDDLISRYMTDAVTVATPANAQHVVGGRNNDTITLGTGASTRTGLGNDSITLTGSNNTVYYNLGDGQDQINLTTSGATGNELVFGAGISAADIGVYLQYNTLELRIGDVAAGSALLISVMRDNILYSPAINTFRFSDGSALAFADLMGRDPLKVVGTEGNDLAYGSNLADLIQTGGGNDGLSAGAGDDQLFAGAGDDILSGGTGSDLLVGGLGNDQLQGGLGADTYVYAAGDGSDRISEYDATAGVTDVLRFGEGITRPNMQIIKDSSSLAIIFAGYSGLVTIEGQIAAPEQRIERFEFFDGTVLTADEMTAIATVGVLPILGNSYNDTIEGTAASDFILGMDGADTLNGNLGDDVLEGNNGADKLNGGDGNDTLRGGADGDTLQGNAGNDTLLGEDGVDALYGDDGNDALHGGTSNDSLRGGNGDDVLYGGDSADDFNTYNENLYGDAGNDILYGDQGVDYLYGGTGSDTLYGGDGIDSLWGDAGSAADGFADTLAGGAGDDRYHLYEQMDVVIEQANEGFDAIYIYAAGTWTMAENVEKVDLETRNENARVIGNDLDNVFWAGSYSYEQYSNSSLGKDELVGGGGNDVYRFVSFNDVVIEAAGGGIDTVYTDQYNFAMGDYIENVTLEHNYIVTYATRYLFGNASDNSLISNDDASSVQLYGRGGNDTLQGHDMDDLLDGGDGDDLLQGGQGSDRLIGGAGSNTLDGGWGNDTLVSTGTGDRLDGGDDDDVLTLGSGSTTCVFTGYHGNDTINAGSGSISLEVNVGSSSLAALSLSVEANGNYIIRTGSASSVTLSQSGMDRLASLKVGQAAYTRDEWFSWLGSNPQNYTNKTLLGPDVSMTAGARYTVSLEGSHYLVGAVYASGAAMSPFGFAYQTPMDSALVTADGRLRLAMTSGITTFTVRDITLYIGSAAADDYHAVTGSGDKWFVGGEGVDTYFVGAGSGRVYIDTRATDAETDVLELGAGFTLSGAQLSRLGNDFRFYNGTADSFTIRNYFAAELVAPVIRLSTGELYDREAVAQLVFGATSGNDVVTGTAADDRLFGWLGDDQLNGLDGNDTLEGGAGADRLAGGAGDDTYLLEDGLDTVVELANQGWDTAYVWGDALALENVEAVYLMAAADSRAIGTASTNALFGNSARNFLNGMGGADYMAGDAGDDTYIVDDNSSQFVFQGSTYTGDVVVEYIDGGNDTVESSVTYTLGSAYVENLTLTGTAAINGTGNAAANVLRGNSAANVLTGGDGNDTYHVGAGDSVVESSASGGIDAVISDVTFTLGNNVENLRLAETATALNATGNTLNNLLIGNSLANTLTGGTGSDRLEGGAGNDLYIVDNVGDVVTEMAGEGLDTVQSSVTCTLSGDVENLTLTGSGAINGTGNELDNVLSGNSGANVLAGGAGNDTYIVSTKDSVSEAAGGGIDTVRSSIAWTLGANLENLVLTGTSKVAGTGNDLDNRIDGSLNSAINALKGGKGNDTYVVGAGDTVTENLNDGVDTVETAFTWTLGPNLENLILTGSAAVNGTGNTLANRLRGNSAANTLTGLAGNDTYLFGRGGGADTLVDSDSTAGNQDLLQLDVGIALDQLWFRHVGTALEISVIGTTDKVTVSNWYGGTANHVEKIQLADGHYLLDSQVEQLVSAMASLTPPPAGQTTLSEAQHQQLDPVLAATWQTA